MAKIQRHFLRSLMPGNAAMACRNLSTAAGTYSCRAPVTRVSSRSTAPPTYLVFGATGGIGAELVQLLASDGAQLVLAARNESKLQELQQRLPQGVAVTPAVVDVLDPEQVDKCIQQAVSSFGKIDGVANCVGSVLLKSAHTTSVSEVICCCHSDTTGTQTRPYD